MQFIEKCSTYVGNVTISDHTGMIPKFENGKYNDKDYFIVDECDSMMLDDPEDFYNNYTSMQEKIGGFFFLTATEFDVGAI